MKKLTVFLLLLLTIQSVFSQSDKKSGISYSKVIQSPVADPVITEIIKNINTSRENNNITAKLYWEGKLHELTNPQIINVSTNTSNFKSVEENQSALEALNITRITGSVIVANSISRERVKGDIYAAIGVYGSAILRDTLKIYRSTNNGISFNLLYVYTIPGLTITPNGIDVEAVSNGDSSYAFVAMSYKTPTNTTSSIIRVRQDGLMQGVVDLPSSATNKYTNIRITSDNAYYTNFSYVYATVTLDSLVSGTRRLKSKLYRIESPFSPALQMVSGYQNPANGQFGYNVTGAAPDTAKFETDIAFVSSVNATDYLFTVTIVRGVPNQFDNGSSLYFTKSFGSGATAPTLFSTADLNPAIKESPRFAATGYLNNSGVVVTRRLDGGGDWDPFTFHTSDITINAPVFIRNYVTQSLDTTLGVSVTANYRSNSSYLFAYNDKTGPSSFATSKVFSLAFNAGSGGSTVQVNPPGIFGTTIYGTPEAAFRNVNNDSCMVIWGGIGGNGSYVTGGCGGTFTNISSSNTIAEGYSLSQNYPNPFNPSTKINYSLPIQSNVSIKVFDIIGKEIESLVKEIQTAGNHSIEFNGVNLPSGVYYYRIEANDFVDTKKMILIK